jgi:hypothetical protein
MPLEGVTVTVTFPDGALGNDTVTFSLEPLGSFKSSGVTRTVLGVGVGVGVGEGVGVAGVLKKLSN